MKSRGAFTGILLTLFLARAASLALHFVLPGALRGPRRGAPVRAPPGGPRGRGRHRGGSRRPRGSRLVGLGPRRPPGPRGRRRLPSLPLAAGPRARAAGRASTSTRTGSARTTCWRTGGFSRTSSSATPCRSALPVFSSRCLPSRFSSSATGGGPSASRRSRSRSSPTVSCGAFFFESRFAPSRFALRRARPRSRRPRVGVRRRARDAALASRGPRRESRRCTVS